MFHEHKNSRFPYLLALILLVLVINSSRSIFEMYSSVGRIDQAKFELNRLKIDNERLKSEISYAQSPEYLQKAAIEELNMAKPGETILIMEQMQPNDLKEESQLESQQSSKPSPLELWATEFNLQNLYFSWQNSDF